MTFCKKYEILLQVVCGSGAILVIFSDFGRGQPKRRYDFLREKNMERSIDLAVQHMCLFYCEINVSEVQNHEIQVVAGSHTLFGLQSNETH